MSHILNIDFMAGFLIAAVLWAAFGHFKFKLKVDTGNPWSMQSDMMGRSGQARPDTPEVNKTSVLYLALCLEELGEMFDATYTVIARSVDMAHPSIVGRNFPGVTMGGAPMVNQELLMKLARLGASLQSEASRIRTMLKVHPDFVFIPTRTEAKALLDGTTDVAVVNCGFAVATGLPGDEAYDEVYLSNRSKANPKTGRVDKTADGKWIKGVNYREPDLDRVLSMQLSPSDNAF